MVLSHFSGFFHNWSIVILYYVYRHPSGCTSDWFWSLSIPAENIRKRLFLYFQGVTTWKVSKYGPEKIPYLETFQVVGMKKDQWNEMGQAVI